MGNQSLNFDWFCFPKTMKKSKGENHEENHGCLGCIGIYTTPCYRVLLYPIIGIPIKQPVQSKKWYCWWFRNPANQLRLVVYPMIYKVLATSNRWLALGFLNHQQ